MSKRGNEVWLEWIAKYDLIEPIFSLGVRFGRLIRRGLRWVGKSLEGMGVSRLEGDGPSTARYDFS